MSTFNERLPALEAAANQTVALAGALTKSRMQVAQEAEIMRRAMHRELSQQAYLICPMNGEVQVSKHEIVEFPELLEMVGQFNRGELPHSDDWFTIEDITEKRYPMEMFYQFIK